jgi:TP901 family phage tail tape measure protein
MANKLNVQVIVGLVDRLSGPLKGLQGRVKALGQKMQQTGLAMTGVGAGIAAAFAPAIRAFADVEDAMTRLQVATMRKGGVIPDTFRDLEDLANTLGDRLPGTTSDFVRMLTMLQRQGIKTETILAGTGEAAANLAVMLQMTPEDAAKFTSQLQDATQTLPEDMLALVDGIQRAFHVGLDPGPMLEAISAITPGMTAIRSEGIAGAKAMLPLLAMLDQAKIGGSMAGTAMSKIFTAGFDTEKIKKANALLRGTGVQPLSFVDSAGYHKGLDSLLTQVETLQKLSPQKQDDYLSTLFGTDGETLRTLAVLVKKGKTGYDSMVASMEDQATLQERMDKLLGTLLNLWDAASGTFTNLQAAIGELLKPEIQALVTWFGEVSAAAKQWTQDNPELAKTLALVTVGIAGLLVALGSLGIVVGTTLWALAPLAGVLAILLSPVALAVAAIAALAYVFTHWEETVALASLAFEWLIETLGFDPVVVVKQKWDALTAYLKQWAANIPQIFDNAIAAMTNVGRNLLDGLWLGISERWEALKAKVAGIANAVTGIFRSETDTQSPSRVFAALGADLMRGLEIGIRAAERLPLAAMRSAAGALAIGAGVAAMPAAAMPSLAWPVPQIDTSAMEAKLDRLTMPDSIRWSDARPVAEPDQGQTTQARAQRSASISISMPITINAPPGTDTQALAALVRREVQGATKAAAGRIAALYDSTDDL